MRRIVDYLLDRPKLFVLILIGLAWILLEYFSGFGYKPVQPKITIKNAGLCLSQYERKPKSVNAFRVGDKQFICAEMEVDKLSVNLTLIIEKEGGRIFSPDFIDANEFEEGFISFQVLPKLPPGKYTARFLYARDTLTKAEFDVIEK